MQNINDLQCRMSTFHDECGKKICETKKEKFRELPE